jgi:hypothetical protein
MTISTLIDKQDTFEIVRDQIGAILTIEIASQMQLATNAGKDPNDYKLRIFTERSNPWEEFLNEVVDTSPLVNVWFDNSSFDPSKSNVVERQASETVYNIDCYGYGRSRDDGATGHIPGDREASFEVQKALRLVRNILMAAEYTYLGLRKTVWHRMPQSITAFQPELDARQMQQIVGARLAFRVIFNEFSPQVEPVDLELLSVDVIRTEDGEIVLEADYDYTAP